MLASTSTHPHPHTHTENEHTQLEGTIYKDPGPPPSQILCPPLCPDPGPPLPRSLARAHLSAQVPCPGPPCPGPPPPPPNSRRRHPRALPPAPHRRSERAEDALRAEAGHSAESSGVGGSRPKRKGFLRAPNRHGPPGRRQGPISSGGRAHKRRGRDSRGGRANLCPRPAGLGNWRPTQYLRSSTSASLSSSSRSNCLVTKLSTAAVAMAAGRPGRWAAEVQLQREAEFPGRTLCVDAQGSRKAVSASGRACGKMAAAVTTRAVTVAFGRLVSACSRSGLRASGPGAGETRLAG